MIDAAVVGGGPVGMWLAAELHRGGARPAVLERRAERSPHSKALTLYPHARAVRDARDRGPLAGRGHSGAVVALRDPPQPAGLHRLGHPLPVHLVPPAAAHRAAAPYITQVVAADGRVAGVQRKRHLGEGEDAYTAAAEPAVFEQAGVRFGVAICAEAGFDAPFEAAAAAGARLVLFPAAPGLYGRCSDDTSWREGFSWWQGSGLGDACRHARRLGLWIALAGQAGSTADEDFPGLAALVRPDGSVAARLPDWRPGVLTVDIPQE